MAGALATLLIAVGGLLSIQRRDQEHAKVMEMVARDAQVAAAHIDQFFRERFEVLETISIAPVVRTGDLEEIKAFFERVVDAGSSFSGGLSLIGTDGVMMLLSGFPLDESAIDLSDRDYVRAVLDSDAPAAGNAIVGRRSGDPLLTFAVPVRDERGTTDGILAGTIRLDLAEGGLAFIGSALDDAVIIDRLGQVVADRGAINRPVPADPAFLSSIREAASTGRMMPGPHGAGTWLGGHAAIGDSGWHAVVLRDSSETLGPADRAMSLELGTLGLLGALGITITVAAARRLDRAAAEEQQELLAVREREQLLREWAEALPVMAGTLDSQMGTTFANRSLRDTGTSRLLDLVHPDDLGDLPDLGSLAGTASVDIRLRDGGAVDGYRWHRARFVRATAQASDRWFFAAVDVDDEKRAELGLQRDIRQRDEFLGLVTHELRTPLTIILGTLALLTGRSRSTLPPAVAADLDGVEASVRQLQRILENMLVLSQAAGSAVEPDLEPQIPGRMVERAVEDFLSRRPGNELAVAVDADLPIVAANEVFVTQVLGNLLSNAFKHAKGAGVAVRATRVGAFVEIAVADRGPGVPAEELTRVFEPYFRARASKGRSPGLGLGLSVCRRLVELQGGTIVARRNEGGGLVFAFTLPVLDDDATDSTE